MGSWQVDLGTESYQREVIFHAKYGSEEDYYSIGIKDEWYNLESTCVEKLAEHLIEDFYNVNLYDEKNDLLGKFLKLSQQVWGAKDFATMTFKDFIILHSGEFEEIIQTHKTKEFIKKLK